MLKHIFSYGVGGVFRAAAIVGFTALFTRVFNPADFGFYSLIKSTVLFVSLLLTEWLKQAINRYLPSAKTEHKKLIIKRALLYYVSRVTVILALVLFAALVVLQFNFNHYFILALIFLWSLSLYELLLQALVSEIKSSRYTLAKIGQALVRLVAAAFLVWALTREVRYLLWGDILSSVMILPFLLKQLGLPLFQKEKTDLALLKAELLKFLRYGLPMMGWFAAYILLSIGDRYIIQVFRGAAELGIYTANYTLIVGFVELLTAPFLLFAHPFLIKAWNKNSRDYMQNVLSKISEWYLYCGVLFVSFLVIVSQLLAGILLGSEYQEGYWIIPVVAAGILVWNLSMYGHKPLEFEEKTHLMMFGGLGAAVINMGLNILFVPRFGYPAAAWTTLASYFCYALFVFFCTKSTIPWRIPWLSVLRKVSFVLLALALSLIIKKGVTGFSFYLLSGIIFVIIAIIIPLKGEGITLRTLLDFVKEKK